MGDRVQAVRDFAPLPKKENIFNSFWGVRIGCDGPSPFILLSWQKLLAHI